MSTSPGQDTSAWQKIGSYGRFWTPFDETFHFRPGKDASTWPAIVEPEGSVTMDLAPVFARENRDFDAGVAEIVEQVLTSLVGLYGQDDSLVALRWQHASYWFWPHRQVDSSQPWCISPFPDGDYVAIATPDLAEGTFGHPWEQTLCVYGHRMVDSLLPRLTPLLPVKRRN